jgi:hypothetical protein
MNILDLISKTNTPIGQAFRERNVSGLVNYWKNPDSLRRAFNPVSMVAGAGTLGGLRTSFLKDTAPNVENMLRVYQRQMAARGFQNPVWKYDVEPSGRAYKMINNTIPANIKAKSASFITRFKK